MYHSAFKQSYLFDAAVCYFWGVVLLKRIFRKSVNAVVIDGDGCPVVRAAAHIAKEYGAACKIICDSSHIFDIEGTNNIVVSQGADSADFYIVNNIRENDIVITQDYGLAAMCLAKRAVVINQDGKEYSDRNINGLLEARAIGKKLRRAGGRTKGPSKRTKAQNESFESTLRRLLENAEI